MFERFTDGARRAVVLAQEEARLFDHAHIGTEHVLLAMLKPGALGEAVADVLAGASVTYDAAASAVVALVPPGHHAPSGHIPFTPNAKKALELSLRASLELGHNHIAAEHLFIGLLSVDGTANRVLERLRVDAGALRQATEAATGAVPPGGPGFPAHPLPASAVAFSHLVGTSATTVETARQRATTMAAELGHREVTSAHFLLAFLDEGTESVAGLALRNLGVDRDRLREEIARLLPPAAPTGAEGGEEPTQSDRDSEPGS